MRVEYPPLQSPSEKGVEWLERCRHWEENRRRVSKRKLRERSAETLVLCGHGISLRVEHGTLLIRNGLTHYPQQREEYRYFRGDLERPARIIVLDGSGHITFDVMDWLAEQSIPLIRVNWQGEATAVIGGAGYAADREKVAWQRTTRADPALRIAFSVDLIARKLENSIATLHSALPTGDARERAIANGQDALTRLRSSPPSNISELHGIEGPAAAAYFEAWQGVSLRWRDTKRSPIPEAWRTLGPRASLREARKSKNRHATHPINAMLNYAYAIALAQLKIRALADGYDPMFGIMHQSADAPAYALDLVEPARPMVDRAVLDFALGQDLHPADFVIRSDGACRINPQLAKHVIRIACASISDAEAPSTRRNRNQVQCISEDNVA